MQTFGETCCKVLGQVMSHFLSQAVEAGCNLSAELAFVSQQLRTYLLRLRWPPLTQVPQALGRRQAGALHHSQQKTRCRQSPES